MHNSVLDFEALENIDGSGHTQPKLGRDVGFQQVIQSLHLVHTATYAAPIDHRGRV
jgi:hypothetical protein